MEAARSVLTPEQLAEAARIEDILMAKTRVEVRGIAMLLASKSNRELFGETEFRVRDAVHRIGAHALDTALEGRKKGGTKGRALRVHGVTNPPNS
jgi:hypothetical protein